MKDTREVVRGIGVTENEKYRVITDADTIAGMFSQSELDAFVESGVLKADNPGEWKSTKVTGESPSADEQAGAEEDAKPTKKAGKKGR